MIAKTFDDLPIKGQGHSYSEGCGCAKCSGIRAQEYLQKPVKSTVQECTELLADAQQRLIKCHQIAVTKNPMAADVEAFKKIKVLGQQINELMREVSKVRGL